MAEETKRVGWQPTRDERIKKRNGWYWARFSRNGTRVEESLGTKSFEIAMHLVSEIESCIKLGVNWKKEAELFESAWPEFLEAKSKGDKTKKARESTLKEYIKMGERYYLPFFKTYKLADIETGWDEFIAWVREQSGDICFDNPHKYLSAFLHWAYKKGKIKERLYLYNPDHGAERDDDEDDEGPGKEYTDRELWDMRMHSVMPFKLAIYMAQYMAMRRSEITQLKRSRIDWKEHVVKLKAIDTKIGRGRLVPIHPAVEPLLLEQYEATKGHTHLFPNRADSAEAMDPGGFKKPWAALKEQLGIEGRFHDFKHTFITKALRSGMNPVVVSKISGTSIKVIMDVYLHLTPKDLYEDLKKLELRNPKDLGQNWDKVEKHVNERSSQL